MASVLRVDELQTTTGAKVADFSSGELKIWKNGEYKSIPVSTSTLYVQLWAAGGGGGTVGGWAFGANGGGGGYAAGEIFGIASGTTLVLQVGEGGLVNGGRVSFGGGGQANRTGGDNRYGSNGGGYSGIFLNSVSFNNSLIIAGGGGGGGSSRAQVGNYGGAGGGSVGQDGSSPYETKVIYRGRGGSGVAGGDQASSDATNTDYPPNQLIGGTCRINGYGGAGGGGYYGGSAGGYSEGNTMAGGGGGSGFINITYVKNFVNERGEYRSPAGASYLGYPGNNVGFGGTPAVAGGNGFVRITNLLTGAVTTYSYTGTSVNITVP